MKKEYKLPFDYCRCVATKCKRKCDRKQDGHPEHQSYANFIGDDDPKDCMYFIGEEK